MITAYLGEGGIQEIHNENDINQDTQSMRDIQNGWFNSKNNTPLRPTSKNSRAAPGKLLYYSNRFGDYFKIRQRYLLNLVTQFDFTHLSVTHKKNMRDDRDAELLETFFDRLKEPLSDMSDDDLNIRYS